MLDQKQWCHCITGLNLTLFFSRYRILCKKVVTAGRLPPASSATKYYSWRSYYQVMTWMGLNQNMKPSEWGWINKEDKLLPIMMENKPAQDILLKMIHCNCSGFCNTLRCTCKKYGLPCTKIFGPCQDSNCQNVSEECIIWEED